MDTKKIKKVIKGIAKTTGKYTLKGIGKGAELIGRGTVKTIHSLVKSKNLHKITSRAGVLVASVLVPAIGATLIGSLGLKYIVDNSILEKNRDIKTEIKDMIKIGDNINAKMYEEINKKILMLTLDKTEKGIKNLGNKYQKYIDSRF